MLGDRHHPPNTTHQQAVLNSFVFSKLVESEGTWAHLVHDLQGFINAVDGDDGQDRSKDLLVEHGVVERWIAQDDGRDKTVVWVDS